MQACSCPIHPHSDTNDTTTASTTSSSATLSTTFDPLHHYIHHHHLNPVTHSHHKDNQNHNLTHNHSHSHSHSHSHHTHHHSKSSRLTRRNTHHQCTHSHIHPHPSTSPTSTRRQSLPSSPVGPLPLHISINLRYAGANRVQLRDDLFIPANSAYSLVYHFRIALARHPTQVGRYVLRQEKPVVVIGKRKESIYVKTSTALVDLTNVRPSRLIFCVYPNVEVMRVLDERKTYSLSMNARTSGRRRFVFDRDVVVDVSGGATVAEVWDCVKEGVKQLEHLEILALQTVRPEDRVGLRFSLQDVVADVVKSGGRRFVFVVEKPDVGLKHLHDREHHQKEEQGVNALGMKVRRLCKHGRRKMQRGLRQKK